MQPFAILVALASGDSRGPPPPPPKTASPPPSSPCRRRRRPPADGGGGVPLFSALLASFDLSILFRHRRLAIWFFPMSPPRLLLSGAGPRIQPHDLAAIIVGLVSGRCWSPDLAGRQVASLLICTSCLRVKVASPQMARPTHVCVLGRMHVALPGSCTCGRGRRPTVCAPSSAAMLWMSACRT
jgi:hypothetical protein